MAHSEEVSAKIISSAGRIRPRRPGRKGPHMEEKEAEEREVPSESDPNALQTEERRGG